MTEKKYYEPRLDVTSGELFSSEHFLLTVALLVSAAALSLLMASTSWA